MKMFGITSVKRKRSTTDKNAVRKIPLYDISEIKQNGGYIRLIGTYEVCTDMMA